MIIISASTGLPKNAYDQSRLARHDDVADKFGEEKAGYRRRRRAAAKFCRVQHGEYDEVQGSKSGQESVGPMALTAAIQPKPKRPPNIFNYLIPMTCPKICPPASHRLVADDDCV